jgi:hypothetical protein
VFAFLTVILTMNKAFVCPLLSSLDYHCFCVGVIQLRVSFSVVNSQQ